MTPGYGSKGPTSKWAGDKTPSGYRTSQLQQFTPEQQQLFSQQFSHLGPESFLSKLASGDQSQFDQMEAPAFRQFNEQLGNISSRFSAGGGGRGSLSSRRSSGFQNATTSAASNFAENLASRRQQLQQQAINDLMGLSTTLLGQRPFDRQLVKKQQNPWGSIVGKLAGAAPGAIAGYFSNGREGTAQGIQGGLSNLNTIAGM